jgi:hypothetical protein
LVVASERRRRGDGVSATTVSVFVETFTDALGGAGILGLQPTGTSPDLWRDPKDVRSE